MDKNHKITKGLFLRFLKQLSLPFQLALLNIVSRNKCLRNDWLNYKKYNLNISFLLIKQIMKRISKANIILPILPFNVSKPFVFKKRS